MSPATRRMGLPKVATVALAALTAAAAAADGNAVRGQALYEERCSGCHSLDFRAIQQLHVSHRCIVTLTETALQNAQISTITSRIARPQHIEQLDHDITIAGAVKRQATVSQARLLAQGKRLGRTGADHAGHDGV